MLSPSRHHIMSVFCIFYLLSFKCPSSLGSLWSTCPQNLIDQSINLKFHPWFLKRLLFFLQIRSEDLVLLTRRAVAQASELLTRPPSVRCLALVTDASTEQGVRLLTVRYAGGFGHKFIPS